MTRASTVPTASASGRRTGSARALTGTADADAAARSAWAREGANASSCIVAYPTSVTTARAADALRAAGFANDDVIGASGSALAAHENAADPCTGILARLGQRWAAFVLAYAPEDGQTTRAADVLLLLGPAELHYYGAFTARSR